MKAKQNEYKKIKVRYTFDIEIEVLKDVSKKLIEFCRNDGCWCADNAIEELKRFKKKNDCCLCPYFTCKCL